MNGIPHASLEAFEHLARVLGEVNFRLEEDVILQPAELNPLFAAVRRSPWPTPAQQERALDDCEVLECYLGLGDKPNAQRSIAALNRRIERAQAALQLRLASAKSRAVETEPSHEGLAI